MCYSHLNVVIHPKKANLSQNTIKKFINSSDLLLLARVINGESHGENIEDKLRVGTVIINRLNSNKFPNTLSEVIFQKGQFDGINSRYFKNLTNITKNIEGQKNYESIQAANIILNEYKNLPNDVYFFCNPKIATDRQFKRLTLKEVKYKGDNHWYF